MISKLLEKGERVDAVTNVRLTLFICFTDYLIFPVSYLKENYTALHIAVESGRPNVVETLLGHGAQVHIKGNQLTLILYTI